MKTAAGVGVGTAGLWGIKAAAASSAKLAWALPMLLITALFVSKDFDPTSPKNEALSLCRTRLESSQQIVRALRRRQEDGSLLVGLTAASFKARVRKGNEDVLRMSPRAMALQIEQLRDILDRYNRDNKRLAAEKRRLEEEKEEAVSQLAKRAVVASADASDGQVACEARVRAARRQLAATKDELETSRTEHMTTKALLDEAREQVDQADVAQAGLKGELHNAQLRIDQSQEALRKCQDSLAAAVDAAHEAAAKGAGTLALANGGSSTPGFQAYPCEATEEDMMRYLNYEPHGACPNDWYFVQRLVFKKNCFALPRRRCRAVTPKAPVEPLPLPAALFDQRALDNRNVRWDLHQCKSFECLNSRAEGDCRQCFNMTMESWRWQHPFRGTLPMKDVIEMKKGTLRLGLDAGGGTGSFAAHMAKFGVTVMTTAFNVETVFGKKAGLPYMETIAARGLIPLHVPHQSRLPLYDGVLDLVHSVNSIKYIPLQQFEELIYEWDRVLRVGGILWFEMFYAPVEEMKAYVAVIERLGYRKLYWNHTPKPDPGEREGEHVYLNCVIEKLPVPGNQDLEGPLPEDTHKIV